jgi:AAA+ ATPase superfamily predicted ATPase/MFS family permease
MATIILQALKSAPRLLRQFLFQPSKAYDFASKSKKNKYILIWTFFFTGLFIGIILAIPHYYFYHNLAQSILFAVAVAFAVAFAGAFAGTFAGAVAVAAAVTVTAAVTVAAAVTGAFAIAVAGAVAGAVAIAVASAGAAAIAGAFAFAVAFAVAFASVFGGSIRDPISAAGKFIFTGGVAVAIAGGVAVVGVGAAIFIVLTVLGAIYLSPAAVTILLFISAVGWFIIYLNLKNKLKLSGDIDIAIILTTSALIAFAGGGGIRLIKTYEMVIYPLALLMGYFFASSFYFIYESKQFKENFRKNKVGEDDLSHQKFGKIQRASLIWGPLLALFIYLPIYLAEAPELNNKLLIAAAGLAAMPIFILHIPDYLLCLPFWLYQRRKILKYENSAEMRTAYKNSLLYKHEMLFLPLPGVSKIMAAFARHKEIGIRQAVEEIGYLYWFTFQQGQAQKAVLILGKDRETAHQCIHFLLAENNHPLLKTLANHNRLAELYLMLSENTERIGFVFERMEREEGYSFNDEMVKSLEGVYHLLVAANLEDLYRSIDGCEGMEDLPGEIGYFTAVGDVAKGLKEVKEDLQKIEAIERFDSKRSFMNEQKEILAALSKRAGEIFYEPFRTIWEKALMHCAELVAKEIKMLQGSAVLVVELRNREILAAEEDRDLYFLIGNKGQVLATDVAITLESESPEVSVVGDGEKKVAVIETGTAKEISFSIRAEKPLKTTVKGTITFSDMTREGKQTVFSFPITILKRSARFREIQNPYTVGRPLSGDTPLFFGRQDAFEFIDKNISASGAHHTIVCHGLRRTGKSSLLYRIEHRGFSNKRLVPINIDMQGIQDERHFYTSLWAAMKDKLALKTAAGEKVESFSRFKEFLQEIGPELGERVAVLMVDEFEEIQMRVEEGRISRAIFSNLRHLMQHEKKLAFIFCGTHKLEEMSADYWSIFFNTALYWRVSFLKREDAVRLIREPVKDQLNYDDLAVEQILKMTGCQPYLIQLICRNLVNDLNETRKRNDAVIDDVDDVVERIIDEGQEHFSRHIWDESTPLERLILSAAAEELTHQQLDHIGREALSRRISTVSSRFSGRDLSAALDGLVSREILKQKDMRYWFPVNLLRRWIAARHPLRKVREEI